jgi:O-antigen/teichoic acid export membrane protein
LLSSGYVRSVATLSAGQFVAAVVPILTAPILGRLYSPADYGALATYMAIASVFGSVSTMQMELAIISERSDRQAVELVVLCRWLSLIVAAIAAVVGLGVFLWMVGNPQYSSSRGWILLLPVTVIATGSTAGIRMLANRMAWYRQLANNLVYSALLSATITIPLGVWGWGANGLFAGYFAGQALTFGMYLALYRKLVPQCPKISRKRLLVLARRHRDFAIFTQPSEFIGTLNRQLPVFALAAIGDTPLLGAFSRARQLISMPLGLLGGSIGQVFRQRASEQFKITGSCEPLYRKTFLVLLAVGTLPTMLLAAFAPDLMRLYLGPKWGGAGQIAQILSPMLLAGFVTSPVSSVFYFQGRQREEFILNSACAVALTAALAAALFFGTGYTAICAFSATYSAIYLAYLLRGWMIARNDASRRGTPKFVTPDYSAPVQGGE